MKHEKLPISLELALRDFFGLIDEPITMEAATLAQALREIAVEDAQDSAAFNVLMSVAAALTAKRSEWQLTLSHKLPGKRPLHHDKEESRARDLDLLIAIEEERGRAGKLESAVAAVSAKFGVSRSEVLKARKRALDRDALLARLRDRLPEIMGIDINDNLEPPIR